MLSKEEENRVTAIRDIIGSEIAANVLYSHEITPRTILWLTEKLKKINAEAKAATEAMCVCVGPSHENSCPLWELPC